MPADISHDTLRILATVTLRVLLQQGRPLHDASLTASCRSLTLHRNAGCRSDWSLRWAGEQPGFHAYY